MTQCVHFVCTLPKHYVNFMNRLGTSRSHRLFESYMTDLVRRTSTAQHAINRCPADSTVGARNFDGSGQAQDESNLRHTLTLPIGAVFGPDGIWPQTAAATSGSNPRANDLRIDTVAGASEIEVLISLKPKKDERRDDLEPHSPTLSTSSMVSDRDYQHIFL